MKQKFSQEAKEKKYEKVYNNIKESNKIQYTNKFNNSITHKKPFPEQFWITHQDIVFK